jgi:hypothetical protein
MFLRKIYKTQEKDVKITKKDRGLDAKPAGLISYLCSFPEHGRTVVQIAGRIGALR